MDAADMLDVIHYFFDEDFRYGSAESAHMHGKVRQHIYKELYGVKYMYALGSSEDASSIRSSDGTEVKPYIPPTEFDSETGIPLDGILDNPLG